MVWMCDDRGDDRDVNVKAGAREIGGDDIHLAFLVSALENTPELCGASLDVYGGPSDTGDERSQGSEHRVVPPEDTTAYIE